MRVVTFNIKHGTNRSGSVDPAGLRRACAGFGADVLALQEVDRRALRSRLADQVSQVARATAMSSAFGEAARKWAVRRYGNALFCAGALSGVEVLPLPAPGNGEFRVAVLASAELRDGKTLSVAATHLSFRKGEGPAQLAVVLEALARRPLPRVLLGDLNLGPEVVTPAVTAAGYALAPTGPTFPAGAPRARIDYVAVAGVEVLGASLPETGMSDHMPVVADLRW
ncbi:MAG: endonuclease/exonuclease/phosphatase family protein [Acidimicrobiia bacterium]